MNWELNVIEVRTMKSVAYGDASTNYRPIWSYDGAKFAAFEEIDNPQSDSSYYSIKIVDTEKDIITNWRIGEDNNAAVRSLTWSPDGNTIAFLQGRNIAYLNTSTGDTTVTNFSLADSLSITAISWHPDGDKISLCVTYIHRNLYRGYIDSTSNSIYMICPYANNLKDLTPVVNYGLKWYNYFPDNLDWNFDGTMMLLSSDHYKILIMDLYEGEIKPIGYVYGNSACWSKDGNYILYQTNYWTSMSLTQGDFYITDINGSFQHLMMKGRGLADWH